MKRSITAGVFVACVVVFGVSTGYAFESKQIELTDIQKQKVQVAVQENLQKVHVDLKNDAAVTTDYLDFYLNTINSLTTKSAFAPGVGQKLENAITVAIHDHGELNYYEPVFFVKSDASEFVVAFKYAPTGSNDILYYQLENGKYVKVETKKTNGLFVDSNVKVN